MKAVQARASQRIDGPTPSKDLALRTHPLVFGLVLFLASDVMIFGGFIAAYFNLRRLGNVWPPAGIVLDTRSAAVGTGLLGTSSATMLFVTHHLARNKFALSRLWLGATILLGTSFVLLSYHDWVANTFRIDSNTYGSLYYIMTGFHVCTSPRASSFMLGEICVYAFVALLLTGTYLAFLLNDSNAQTIYNGPYASLAGRSVPASYASVLDISFSTKLGLLVRQTQHWAALAFIGAVVFHLMRIFFTGAFRRPRELNWFVGMTLFLLAIGEGFCGYSLPGDLLSGAGLRIAYSVAQSIPIVGTWFAFGFFGGTFPADATTPRLYILHVWVIPILLAGAIATHLGMVWRQHHMQFAGPGRTEENVVGSSVWQRYALKSIALMSATFAVLAFLGGFFTINPVWMYGPYDGWTIASPAQPDLVRRMARRALRIGPAFELHVFGHTISPLFWSGIVLPGILVAGLYAWPLLERNITGDEREQNIIDMPYDKPVAAGRGRRDLDVRYGDRLCGQRRHSIQNISRSGRSVDDRVSLPDGARAARARLPRGRHRPRTTRAPRIARRLRASPARAHTS